jgi:diaminopimelate epimerase
MINEKVVKMIFDKMHGTGNDFIVIDNRNDIIELEQITIKNLCERKFGIGADGLILVETSEKSDIKMNYYNSDGTVAEMCGNGVRCFAKYVHDYDIIKTNNFSVDTLAGEIGIRIIKSAHNKSLIEVNMGKVNFLSDSIPVKTDKERMINETTEYQGHIVKYSCASMGNPHMVIEAQDITDYPVEIIGPYYENHVMYPENCNINFVDIVDSENINILTYERGVGFTLSCGTGSCAAFACLNEQKKVSDNVKAVIPGGELILQRIGDLIFMTGEAAKIYTGEINLEDFR